MTYRIVLAENGDSYLRKTIVLDALLRSDGTVEWRKCEPAAHDAFLRCVKSLEVARVEQEAPAKSDTCTKEGAA